MPSAQEALAHVMSHNKRILTEHPRFTDEQVPPRYIFNTYQMEWPVNLGGLGRYLIPACPEGKPYSEPMVVRFLAEDYDLADGAGHMAWRPVMPEDLAKDIVGLGSATPGLELTTTNREWWGVFISDKPVPSKEQLAEARSKVEQMMTLLMREGDRLALQGPKGLEQIGEMHRRAVAWKGQAREWAKLPETLIDCPGCGEKIRPGIARHSVPYCGAIIDREKAKSLGMEIPEEPKRK